MRHRSCSLLPRQVRRLLAVGALSVAASAGTAAGQTPPPAPAWTSIADMPSTRDLHTATLLPSGKVLVAGGTRSTLMVNDGPLVPALLWDPVTDRWEPAAAMKESRTRHTATMLPNGKVLVAGGSAANPTSAELYDPVADTWTRTGSMRYGRSSHSATLLANGKVLVAGGTSGSFSMVMCEVYDPATGTWSDTGDLPYSLTPIRAVLLQTGKVLATGFETTTLLLYDPDTGTWGETGAMAVPRAYSTLTALPDGKVLLAGGRTDLPYPDYYSNPAELYDPATGTVQATGRLAVGRFFHSAVLLPSGKVMVSGGWGAGSTPPVTIELYDPATGTWSDGPPIATARLTHTLSVLADGRVVSIGGGYPGYAGWAYRTSELLDTAAVAWRTTGDLPFPRSRQTATPLATGSVLAAGGIGPDGSVVPDASVYDPTSGTWSARGSLNEARVGHTATLLGSGQVLVTGGIGADGTAVTNPEVYDPAHGVWSIATRPAVARSLHTATLLGDGTVLLAGGAEASASHSAEVFDPASRTWRSTGNLVTGRSGHTATLLPDGRVLVAGGEAGGAVSAASEVYDPTSGTWSAVGGLRTARAHHSATLLPDGTVLVAGGVTQGGAAVGSAEVFSPTLGAWWAVGSLGTPRAYHSATMLANGAVLAAGGWTGGAVLTSAELYDPASGTWSTAGDLGASRYDHVAVLLPPGSVLLAGGRASAASFTCLQTAEIFERVLGFAENRRAAIASSTLSTDRVFTAEGVGLRGYGSSAPSPADYPLVQLRRLDNDQIGWLSPAGFTAVGYWSRAIRNMPAGPVAVTVFTNGVPSLARVQQIQTSLAASVTVVASSANPSAPLEWITLTATVSVPPGSPNPTGIVRFTDEIGAIAGCTGVALAASRQAGCTTAPTAGIHQIVATYSGDANASASTSAPLVQAVPSSDGSPYLDAFAPTLNGSVEAVAVQPDGAVLIGGKFTTVNGGRRAYLGRLTRDGALDPFFAPAVGSGAGSPVTALVVQPDGRVLVAGDFTILGGAPRRYLGRLNADGSLDATFDPAVVGDVKAVVLQPDGRIVIGGFFTTVGGVARSNIARLNPDGSLDVSFDPGASSYVRTLALQDDHKIVVGGSFERLGGGGTGVVSRKYLARINADGSLDSAFDPGANASVDSVVIQADTKILVAGSFGKLGGGGTGVNNRNYIGRLLSGGSIDAAYNPGANLSVSSMTLQQNGSVIVAGYFTQIGGGGSGSISRPYLARLLPDGTVDSTFAPTPDSNMRGLAIQADGRLLRYGTFTTIAPRAALARLVLGTPTERLSARRGTRTVTWERGGVTPELSWVVFDASADRVTYTRLGRASRAAGGWRLTGAVIPEDAQFVRALGYAVHGYGNGSASLVESVADFPLPQAITFASLPGRTIGDPDFTVDASASSGLAVTFSAAGACTVAGAIVHLTGTGTCTITASQPGDAAYDSAPDVSRAFSVRSQDAPVFTDDPLQPGVTPVKAAHISELRQHINALRARVGLEPVAWTDPALVAGTTTVKAVHITELRTALTEVYERAGRAAPAFTPLAVGPGQAVVAASQIMELRDAVLAVW